MFDNSPTKRQRRLPLSSLAAWFFYVLALPILTSCAARQPPANAQEELLQQPSSAEAIRFDPLEIHPGAPEDVALSELNPEELMAMGQAAFAEGNFDKSARAFGRVADVWPDSPLAASAAFQAGLSLEREKKFLEAGNRFSSVADASRGHGEALSAAFHLAQALYHLEDYERAERILATIGARSDLEHDQMLEAFVHAAVCQVELGRTDEGEQGLKHAIAFWKLHKNDEPFDIYLPAQAQFFLGEVSRLKFEAIQLDASKGDEALTEDLEKKCRLLLEAQERYLVAIRMNQSHWATAAGFRVGALYERLYDEMISAAPPEGMSGEEMEIYREELLKKVRILVTKALPIYEQTLAAAERTGTKTPLVEKARAGLERLRGILTQEDMPQGNEALSPMGDGNRPEDAPTLAPSSAEPPEVSPSPPSPVNPS